MLFIVFLDRSVLDSPTTIGNLTIIFRASLRYRLLAERVRLFPCWVLTIIIICTFFWFLTCRATCSFSIFNLRPLSLKNLIESSSECFTIRSVPHIRQLIFSRWLALDSSMARFLNERRFAFLNWASCIFPCLVGCQVQPLGSTNAILSNSLNWIEVVFFSLTWLILHFSVSYLAYILVLCITIHTVVGVFGSTSLGPVFSTEIAHSLVVLRSGISILVHTRAKVTVLEWVGIPIGARSKARITIFIFVNIFVSIVSICVAWWVVRWWASVTPLFKRLDHLLVVFKMLPVVKWARRIVLGFLLCCRWWASASNCILRMLLTAHLCL